MIDEAKHSKAVILCLNLGISSQMIYQLHTDTFKMKPHSPSFLHPISLEGKVLGMPLPDQIRVITFLGQYMQQTGIALPRFHLPGIARVLARAENAAQGLQERISYE